MKTAAAALVALVLLQVPAGASTLQEREKHISKYLTNELTPEEPWAHTKQVWVTDGWAKRPSILKAAWVSFINAKGYIKPPPQPEVQLAESSSTVTPGIGAQVGVYAIPTYIVMCESGGNYLAENAYSTASGAYQIIDGTWAGYGGYSHASHAPPAVQDAKAAELWANGAGAFHWAACL